MANVSTPDFIDVFIPEFLNYLKKSLPDVQNDLLSHADEIIRGNAAKVQNWTVRASTGELSLADVRWLITSQLDLSGMNSLKMAGLSLVKIDEMRQALVSSLITSIFKVNILK
ncbi:hypothetical protein HQ496_12965 [bacterium]|nr:hypothetical protein [bacterium]